MVSEMATARQRSEKECRQKLTEIVRISSTKYRDFWDAKGETHIEVLRGHVSQEEIFYVDLIRKGKSHWYAVSGRGNELFSPLSAARIINSNLPNTNPQELEDTFYASLKGPFGEYLAEREIAKRKSQE